MTASANAQPISSGRSGVTLPRGALVIPALVAVELGLLFVSHRVFFEWDGLLQIVAGQEIWAGRGYDGYASHYWPPLFPLLTGFLSHFMSAYAAGKLVSLVAAVGLLYLVYALAMEWWGDRLTAILCQAFVALNTKFLVEGMRAENRLLDTFFFVLCFFLIIRTLRSPTWQRFAMAGVVAGLAGLTRYPSYVLLPIGVAAIAWTFRDERGRALRFAAWFAGSWAAVSVPWWIYNTIAHGAPLATWQYLNLGISMFPEGAGGKWLFSDQGQYSGVWDLIRNRPAQFLAVIGHNLRQILVLTFQSVGTLELLLLPAVADGLFERDRHARQTTVLAVAGYVLWVGMVSLVLIPLYIVVLWMVFGTMLCVRFLVKYIRWTAERVPIVRQWRLGWVLVAVLLVQGVRKDRWAVADFGGPHHDGSGRFAQAPAISRALSQRDPGYRDKLLMAYHPSWGYELGATRWVQLPIYYRGDFAGLVALDSMNEKAKSYIPRWPARTPNSQLHADYVVLDSDAVTTGLPQFGPLLRSDSLAPPSFRAIYRSPSVVVFDVRGGDSTAPPARR